MPIQILLSIAIVLWLCLIYLGVGTVVYRALKLDGRLNQGLSLIVRFTIGFGIMGNILTLMGFANLYSRLNILILLLCATAVSLSVITTVKNDIINTGLSIYRIFSDNGTFWLVFSILLFGGYAARAMLPPSGFDTLMYHLSTVKLYLAEGGFWDIFFNSQSDYPMLSQMHYLVALALGNDIVCKGLSTVLFFLLLGVLYQISNDLSKNSNCAFFSVMIFLTLPTIVANASSCYVDIHQSLWSLLALFLFMKYYENKNTGLLILTAFIAGMAVQTKIFGVFIIPVLIGSMFFENGLKLRINRKILLDASVIISIPVLMGAVWYYKSHIYTETILSRVNPLTQITDINYLSASVRYLTRFITAPWTYTIFPSFHRGDTFGPILLMVLPFLLLIKKEKKVFVYSFAAAVYLSQIIFMDIFVLNTQSGTSGRYVIFILAVLTPLVPYTLDQLKYDFAKKALSCMVILSIALGGMIFIKRYNRDWLALLKMQTRDEYYLSVLPQYDVIQKINRLDTDKKVLLAYNFSEYLIDIPYIAAHRRYENGEEMLEDLKSKNVGYVFANNPFDTLENRTSYGEIGEFLEPVYGRNGFYLFRIVY